MEYLQVFAVFSSLVIFTRLLILIAVSCKNGVPTTEVTSMHQFFTYNYVCRTRFMKFKGNIYQKMRNLPEIGMKLDTLF